MLPPNPQTEEEITRSFWTILRYRRGNAQSKTEAAECLANFVQASERETREQCAQLRHALVIIKERAMREDRGFDDLDAIHDIAAEALRKG